MGDAVCAACVLGQTGAAYDSPMPCVNDPPLRALCGFVPIARAVIGTRIRACRWQVPGPSLSAACRRA